MVEDISQASMSLQTEPGSRPHILVVDDDYDIRRLNHQALTLVGNQVDTAEDGAIAWQALKLKRYDLLITDNILPKVSGVKLIEKVHAVKMALPVIMITGIMPTWEFFGRPWLQPSAVVLKPYTMEDLLKAVKAVLSETNNFRKPLASPDQMISLHSGKPADDCLPQHYAKERPF